DPRGPLSSPTRRPSDLSGDYVSIMIAEGLLEPIDASRLANFGNLDPAAIARIGFDPGNRYSVPFMMAAAGVSVNRTKVSGYEHKSEEHTSELQSRENLV